MGVPLVFSQIPLRGIFREDRKAEIVTFGKRMNEMELNEMKAK